MHPELQSEERAVALGLLEAASDALLVVDPAGNVVFFNASAERLFGWSRADIVGKSIDELLPASTRVAHRIERAKYWSAPATRPMGGGKPYRARHRDGHELLAEIGLSPFRVAGQDLVAVAVREPTPHALKLAEAERNFRELIEHASDCIFIADLEGRYTHVNGAACELLGYSRHELLGKTIVDLIPPEDVARLWSAREELRRGGAVQVAEWTLLHRSGEPIPVEISAKILPDGRWQAFARDIRGRRRQEQVLADLRTNLESRERLATVGTLAAGIGHELNNPLASVVLNLSLAAERLEALTPEPERERLRSIADLIRDASQGTQRIAKIVNALNVCARPASSERTAVNLPDALRGSVELALGRGHRVRLETDFRPVPQVWVDESQIVQVFVNLLTNAVQAFGNRPRDQNVVRLATSTDASGAAVVVVSDNGPGMTPEVRARIFEPFFTTKPVGHGAGLGLSVVHGIVSSAGGQVDCRSEPGRGTTFRIVLPAYHGAVEPLRPTISAPPATRRARLLVVDDEPMITSVVRSLLAADHDVVVASGGTEALDLLAADPSYDLVLCDVMMPGMTGRDVYQRLESTNSPLLDRLVFMTGGATSHEMQDFLDGVPWLSKPFSARTLRELVAGRLHRGTTSAPSSPERESVQGGPAAVLGELT